jgi:hypothetical protein
MSTSFFSGEPEEDGNCANAACGLPALRLLSVLRLGVEVAICAGETDLALAAGPRPAAERRLWKDLGREGLLRGAAMAFSGSKGGAGLSLGLGIDNIASTKALY